VRRPQSHSLHVQKAESLAAPFFNYPQKSAGALLRSAQNVLLTLIVQLADAISQIFIMPGASVNKVISAQKRCCIPFVLARPIFFTRRCARPQKSIPPMRPVILIINKYILK